MTYNIIVCTKWIIEELPLLKMAWEKLKQKTNVWFENFSIPLKCNREGRFLDFSRRKYTFSLNYNHMMRHSLIIANSYSSITDSMDKWQITPGLGIR